MTFHEFAAKFRDHEQFVSASLEQNSQGDLSPSGTEYMPGMPEYLLDMQFISGSVNIQFQFEGEKLDDILEQATDHVNLILVLSTI